VTSFKNTRDRRAYTVEEVARLLGVSRGSAYEAVRCGVIRSLTIGRRTCRHRLSSMPLATTRPSMADAMAEDGSSQGVLGFVTAQGDGTDLPVAFPQPAATSMSVTCNARNTRNTGVDR